MFGFRRSIGYFDHCSHFDDGWGPNRSNWNDKSDAALRREQQADNLFEAFLKKCSSYDVNDKSIFPVTEEVVDASIHLTGACYTSFRKRVIAKGCKLKVSIWCLCIFCLQQWHISVLIAYLIFVYCYII